MNSNRRLLDGEAQSAKQICSNLPENNVKPKNGLKSLSPRQMEIAKLVAEGWSDKEVGRRLNLTDGTVGWHLKIIFSRLRIHSRTMLAGKYRLDFEKELNAPPPHEREGGQTGKKG